MHGNPSVVHFDSFSAFGCPPYALFGAKQGRSRMELHILTASNSHVQGVCGWQQGAIAVLPAWRWIFRAHLGSHCGPAQAQAGAHLQSSVKNESLLL